MESIGVWQLVIIFLILLLVFGSNKIKSFGKDLGESIKGFKDSVDDNTDGNISTNKINQLKPHE